MSKAFAPDAAQPNAAQKVRLDKWLWAARFFKTRSLAKTAIDGGKVHCNGERCKGSREIAAGMTLQIRQGWDERTVVVRGISEQRGGAPQAALLYEETAESIAARERLAAERKAQHLAQGPQNNRPTKQDRRRIHRFKQDLFESQSGS
ncbi:MAG: ribosome-associated heat shock protein Hsp15 [Pseudomonadales bacterium]|jgi:ribosome-associated heat shock protein Hsp15|nr:ribosome-associated heat shock protein Hsp15 [Pseudomonadales bacterium]